MGTANIIDVPSTTSFELSDLEKTGPVRLLENRRAHLMAWIGESDHDIARCETEIKATKENAIAMMAELDEIEAALNVIEANAARVKESNNGGQ